MNGTAKTQSPVILFKTVWEEANSFNLTAESMYAVSLNTNAISTAIHIDLLSLTHKTGISNISITE